MSGLRTSVRILSSMSRHRMQARLNRVIQKLLSPTRFLATLAAAIFLAVYVMNGVLIVLTRKPVAPDVVVIWLGGAMAIYALFHCLRAAWQEPGPRLGLSAAEALWIGRAPIPDFLLVLYRITSVVPSTFVKCLLISVVMRCDVKSPLRLIVGLLLAMMVLESLRMIADLVSTSLSKWGRRAIRAATAFVAIALVVQVIARMINASAGVVHPLAILASFSTAIGETAGCPLIRSLAVLWHPMTQFAMANDWGAATLFHLGLSVLVTVASFAAVIAADGWTRQHQGWVEGSRLNNQYRGMVRRTNQTVSRPSMKSLWKLPHFYGIGPLVARQWAGVVRYRSTILLSLGIPSLLSLSPLWTTQDAGLLHVAAWIAVATLLLAPPALRIDFRRDIGRMGLLKSLPISPLAMTVGQILLPSAITIAFQVLVVAVACCLTPAAPATILLLIGALSGFAVFSFALENALFLTFPHQPKQEGLAMMVRAKLVFLGKGLLLGMTGGTFIGWVTVCHQLNYNLFTLILMIILASWAMAAAAVALTSHCWRRFDMRLDTPLLH